MLQMVRWPIVWLRALLMCGEFKSCMADLNKKQNPNVKTFTIIGNIRQ
jgi:hypothetical protein